MDVCVTHELDRILITEDILNNMVILYSFELLQKPKPDSIRVH